MKSPNLTKNKIVNFLIKKRNRGAAYQREKDAYRQVDNAIIKHGWLIYPAVAILSFGSICVTTYVYRIGFEFVPFLDMEFYSAFLMNLAIVAGFSYAVSKFTIPFALAVAPTSMFFFPLPKPIASPLRVYLIMMARNGMRASSYLAIQLSSGALIFALLYFPLGSWSGFFFLVMGLAAAFGLAWWGAAIVATFPIVMSKVSMRKLKGELPSGVKETLDAKFKIALSSLLVVAFSMLVGALRFESVVTKPGTLVVNDHPIVGSILASTSKGVLLYVEDLNLLVSDRDAIGSGTAFVATGGNFIFYRKSNEASGH